MDKNGRWREARDLLTMRGLQQILPGVDRDAAYVRSGRPKPIVQRTRIIRYDNLTDVLTPKEVQAFLRLGRNAVYAALQDGEIRSRFHHHPCEYT